MRRPMNESDWKPTGPELDASGNLIGAPKRTVVERPPKTESEPSPASPTIGSHGSGWSEPAAPPVPVEPPLEEVASLQRRTGVRVGALFAVICLVALGGSAVWWGQSLLRSVQVRLPSPPAPLLSVSSEPPGATVRINGASVGETPIFMDNLYPADKAAKVELVLKGYRPWTGTFRGGEVARIEATLERR
jgi:hypothetical protein